MGFGEQNKTHFCRSVTKQMLLPSSSMRWRVLAEPITENASLRKSVMFCRTPPSHRAEAQVPLVARDMWGQTAVQKASVRTNFPHGDDADLSSNQTAVQLHLGAFCNEFQVQHPFKTSPHMKIVCKVHSALVTSPAHVPQILTSAEKKNQTNKPKQNPRTVCLSNWSSWGCTSLILWSQYSFIHDRHLPSVTCLLHHTKPEQTQQLDTCTFYPHTIKLSTHNWVYKQFLMHKELNNCMLSTERGLVPLACLSSANRVSATGKAKQVVLLVLDMLFWLGFSFHMQKSQEKK